MRFLPEDLEFTMLPRLLVILDEGELLSSCMEWRIRTYCMSLMDSVPDPIRCSRFHLGKNRATVSHPSLTRIISRGEAGSDMSIRLVPPTWPESASRRVLGVDASPSSVARASA